jgi:hypothetical protein
MALFAGALPMATQAAPNNPTGEPLLWYIVRGPLHYDPQGWVGIVIGPENCAGGYGSAAEAEAQIAAERAAGTAISGTEWFVVQAADAPHAIAKVINSLRSLSPAITPPFDEDAEAATFSNYCRMVTTPRPVSTSCDITTVNLELSVGWHIIAGSPNLQGVSGPFWSLQDGQYVQVPRDELFWGVGYWAYVDRPTTATSELVNRWSDACNAHALQSRDCGGWQMFGNRFAARLSFDPAPGSADFRYDAATGQYALTFDIDAGEGVFAWVPPEYC